MLFIGGGDGGVVHELVNPSVKQFTVCELDSMVLVVAKKFLPQMSVSLSTDNVTIFQKNGAIFLNLLIN